MELSAGAARTHITTAECACRRAQVLCMLCGGVGHFDADCPLARARPVGKRRTITAVATAGGTIVAIDSDDESDSDQEGKGEARV